MKDKRYQLKYKLYYVFVVLFIFHLSLFIFPQLASAHVLESDGTVGAVLHVSPDDDPVAGVPTQFFFEFKDKTKRFTPKNCDCTVTVFEGGKEVYSQPLFQNSTNPSLENASFSYTFSTKDVYKLQVKGTPVSSGDFDPFTLAWDLRVDRDATSNTEKSSQQDWFGAALPYILTLAGVVIFVGLMLSRRKR